MTSRCWFITSSYSSSRSRAGLFPPARPSAWVSGASLDLRLAVVVFRVQHVVLDPRALEHARERLRHIDVDRTHEHRVSERVQPLRLLEDRVVLLAAGPI